MVRIDMSEFMEKHAVSRLIGAPPGYVGYDEGGVLTEAVRRRPVQVILFDEVEKAHEDVFNVLLQVLDDGRLTDGQGRTVDFKQHDHRADLATWAATSWRRSRKASRRAMVQAQVMRVVREHFRPEFLNRLDEIVLFRRLQRSRHGDDRGDPAEASGAAAGGSEHAIAGSSAREWLAEEGYDPVYGARPLKRVIQRKLQNPLAGLMLEGAMQEGETVPVTAEPMGVGYRRTDG